MKIVGIDPGFAIVGYGSIEYSGGHFKVGGFGAVTTDSKMDFNHRLKIIYDDMCSILDKYQPDEVAIEKLYFNTNQKTAIDVAQARGVIILACINRNIPVFEYTPLQVKIAITGYGRATKNQIQEMTRNLLRLSRIIKPDDTADAVAIAITHAYSVNQRKILKKYSDT